MRYHLRSVQTIYLIFSNLEFSKHLSHCPDNIKSQECEASE